MNENLEQSNEKEQQHPENYSAIPESAHLSSHTESTFDAVRNLLQKARSAPTGRLPLSGLQDLLQPWKEAVSQVWLYQKHGEGWHQYIRIEHFTSKDKSAYKVNIVAFDELDIEVWESFDFDAAE